jgi:hypothetical protein
MTISTGKSTYVVGIVMGLIAAAKVIWPDIMTDAMAQGILTALTGLGFITTRAGIKSGK